MNDLCPIWNTEASVEQQGDATLEIFNSPRAGGRYALSRRAKTLMSRDLETFDNRFKARLTSWLVDQRALGYEYPKITDVSLRELEIRKGLSVHERADRLLKAVSRYSPRIGHVVGLEEPSMSMNLLAHSESVDHTELHYLLNYLVSELWIGSDAPGKALITVQGYARLAKLEAGTKPSDQAFVAMWFDESMNRAWEEGVRPGVEDAGYKPVRVDQVPHNDRIDDQIIAELRRSRFVVADFTHGDDGARGGVYYEAGFAHGLNLPVIFCCHKDALDKVHFDTRQYNHIEWTEPEDLRVKLRHRITAVIGDGPGR